MARGVAGTQQVKWGLFGSALVWKSEVCDVVSRTAVTRWKGGEKKRDLQVFRCICNLPVHRYISVTTHQPLHCHLHGSCFLCDVGTFRHRLVVLREESENEPELWFSSQSLRSVPWREIWSTRCTRAGAMSTGRCTPGVWWLNKHMGRVTSLPINHQRWPPTNWDMAIYPSLDHIIYWWYSIYTLINNPTDENRR